MNCRRQLLLVRTEQTNRRGATGSKAALKAIDAVLKVLDKQVAGQAGGGTSRWRVWTSRSPG